MKTDPECDILSEYHSGSVFDRAAALKKMLQAEPLACKKQFIR